MVLVYNLVDVFVGLWFSQLTIYLGYGLALSQDLVMSHPNVTCPIPNLMRSCSPLVLPDNPYRTT